MRRTRATIAAVLSVVTLSASAQESAGPVKLEVEHAWARASAGPTGAAYFSVTNHGVAPDRLIAVRTPWAEKAELHEDKVENGVMKMRPLGPLTIGPGESAVLKPGADHVMLMGLKEPLKQGERFPLTLSFEAAGDVQVMVQVERAGAMGPDATAHGAMQQMHHGEMNHGSVK
jgi:copper(I)-binding protein